MTRAILATLALALCASCGRSARPGNVALFWVFPNGDTCATLGPAVAEVDVVIPGEPLANGGAYDCDVAGTDGIQLTDFAPGSYEFSVTTYDVYGNATYGASGGFDVDGDVAVDVDLAPLVVVR